MTLIVFVLFDAKQDATKVLKKDQESTRNRYIVLFFCPTEGNAIFSLFCK